MDDPFETEERRALRATVRRFVEREVAPHLDGWKRAGEVPRVLHERAAILGIGGGTNEIMNEVIAKRLGI